MDYEVVEDHHKRRLTDCAQIELAVAVLEAEGVHGADLLAEMLKSFYVDLDAFDEVMREAA